jgi:outer membrane receptor protein involved in Fe transport
VNSELTIVDILGAATPVNTTADANLDRISFYAYENYQILDSLRLIAGVSYDRLHYPLNIDTSPIIDTETTTDKVSPKGGILWTPAPDSNVRAFYSQSLGGFSLDNSVRLEPAQIAGFNQTFRSAIPESVVGLVPGTEFESYGVGFDQVFKKTGTYFTIDGQILNSDADRTIGMITNGVAPIPQFPSSTIQTLDYKEKSLIVSANQLLGQEVSIGARYRLTYADLEQGFPDLSPTTAGLPPANVSATLNQMWLYVNYNDPCGFFSQFSSVWSSQSNRGYAGTSVGTGDSFWQFNLIGGYRFLRRHIEASVGVLNIGGNDYQLNPLTLYNELPRERTFVARLKFYF